MTRRDRILQAAEKLLRHYGPDKTTMSDIARAAGVGVGSIYLEFANKQAIFEHLSEHQLTGLAGQMEQLAAGAEPVPQRIAALLRARVEGLLAVAREGTHGADLVGHCCPAMERARCRFGAREKELLVSLLREGQARGELAVEQTPEQLAESIGLGLRAFAAPHLFEEPAADRLAQLDRLIHLLLRGLEAR